MKTVKDLAEYLGNELNSTQIESLIELIKFDNMKKYLKFDQSHYSMVLDKNSYEFFKKGQIGNWKNKLTEEMSRKIDDMVKFKLRYKYKDSIKYEPSNNRSNITFL